jgi:hypothetical protein
MKNQVSFFKSRYEIYKKINEAVISGTETISIIEELSALNEQNKQNIKWTKPEDQFLYVIACMAKELKGRGITINLPEEFINTIEGRQNDFMNSQIIYFCNPKVAAAIKSMT